MIGFIRRLLGRGTPLPIDRREWNEDWEAGDLALCIAGTWPLPFGPQEGRIYRVREIKEAVEYSGAWLIVGLGLVEMPCFWACTAFKKVRPDTDAADEEFVAELRDRLKIGAPA